MSENKVEQNLRVLSSITSGMHTSMPRLMDKITDKKVAELNNKYTMMLNYSSSLSKDSNLNKSSAEDFIKKMTAGNSSTEKTSLYPDIESDLRDIHSYKKKFYSLLSDYEIMPSLVPSLIRVLNFLVTDTISPDAQNPGKSFAIKCSNSDVTEEIEKIRLDHNLDNILSQIVETRFRVGQHIRIVQGYNTFFSMVSQMMDNQNGLLTESLITQDIRTVETSLRNIGDSMTSEKFKTLSESTEIISKDETFTESINLTELNISIEYGSICKDYADRINGLNASLNEASRYSSKNILNGTHDRFTFGEYMLAESVLIANPNISNAEVLNEAIDDLIGKEVDDILNENIFQQRSSLTSGVISDKEKITKLVKKLAKDDNIRRCSDIILDPSRTFLLKAGGRVIGCFEYTEDSSENKKDFVKLISKTVRNSKIGKDAYQFAEEEIARKTAEAMIASIKSDLSLSTFEEVDLFRDYLNTSGITKGNKKFKFYHVDDLFDFSREKGSLFVNCVYTVKMLAFLKHNNITTKIAKGRDREIFYVNMGASPSIRSYLTGAMETLASGNDGVYRAINGPMNRILNPYQNSTIVIPVEDGAEKFINADVISGQTVDMDDDLVTFLTKEAIISCDVDPAIVDLTTNNVDFAKSLSMISRERSSKTIAEQVELTPTWKRFVLKILYESGSDALRTVIDNGEIDVKLFSPKSLLLDIVQNEINNARSFADLLVDIHPLLSNIKETDDISKSLATYEIVRDFVSESLDKYDPMIEKVLNEGYAKTFAELKRLNAIRSAEPKPKDIDEEDYA
jgi:hypothetical protein